MGAIDDLFGEGGAAQQLLVWQVLGQILGSLMQPALNEVTQLLNHAAPTAVLSPADVADAVVRGFLDPAAGADIALKSGVNGGDFTTMVQLAGDAPSVTDLMMALRRKLIPFDAGGPGGIGVVQGIAQGRLADKWTPMYVGLADVPLGVADAVDAAVEGQISLDDAAQIAYENGISNANFQILYNTRGNPPDLTTLADLYRRGDISLSDKGPDALSVVQGISEGAIKDKWIPALLQTLTVLPPARTVTALQKSGSITQAQALAYYQKLGLDQETAAAYVADAVSGKVATHKQLSESDVIALYNDGAIDAPTASGLLGSLGYEQTEAAYILQIQDMHQAVANINAAITKIKGLYVARKLSVTDTVNALNSLSVPPAQQQQLMSTWEIEATSNVKVLTAAEITDGWNYGILDEPTAMQELQNIGYSQQDAYVLLSIKNQGPLASSAPPAGGGPTG